MLYKKGIFISLFFIVLIILGLFYTLRHHEDQKATISYQDGHYYVTPSLNETVKIHANNLISHEQQDEVLTKSFNLPKETTLITTFSAKEKEFLIELTATSDSNFKQTTKIPSTKRYNAYIPYSVIKDGNTGLFVGTDDPSILKQIKEQPDQLDQFFTDDIILLEQSILFEKNK
ncbi:MULTISPECIES: hypothetical protein [Enterococcus]|uniref:Uncharacterized protein n=1 Tax=Enterococcus sulfureus ATCC 49903 TaxID=1140003 RepID=S0L7Y1_9ENTE|nr:hypothetical protein [Enterococcus sulfureus]EOT47621.1 hypothetical protein OMY_00995 [Enterococcus sulfureus ATCC 49903]EOT83958.1 hypothetical protein I573_01683 [Enterococcus sulfureus ATCC 49903]